MSTDEVQQALDHADWWAGRHPVQGEMTTTDTMRILSDEVRRLQELAEHVDE